MNDNEVGTISDSPAPPVVFTIPEGNVAEMTFEECQKEIDITDQQMKDPRHPLSPVRQDIDPRKKAFSERRFAVYQRRAETNITPNPADKILEQVKEKEQVKTKARYDSACADMKALVAAGYEEAVVPEDITEGRARCLRMQRLNAEGGQANLNQLSQMMSADLKAFNETPEVIQLFETFSSAEFNPDLRRDLANRIIKYLDEAHKKVGTPASGFNPRRFGG